jgi:uncharacterized membrane protein YtjA (UPF0391 family)
MTSVPTNVVPGLKFRKMPTVLTKTRNVLRDTGSQICKWRACSGRCRSFGVDIGNGRNSLFATGLIKFTELVPVFRVSLMSHRRRHWRFYLENWRDNMGNLLHYAVVFLVVALVAAFLGFGGVAGTAMDGARILFWVALVLFAISLLAGLIRRA